jgi:hypothetical protein
MGEANEGDEVISSDHSYISHVFLDIPYRGRAVIISTVAKQSRSRRRPVKRVVPLLCDLAREFYFVSLYSHSAGGPAPRSIPQPIPFRGIDRRIRDLPSLA